MTVLNDTDTVKAIINNLKTNKRVGYFRFGDGDFIIMYPESVGRLVGKNNQSVVSEEIQKKIIESYNVEDDSYFIGTVNGYVHNRSTHKNVDSKKIEQLKLTQHKQLYSAIALQETFFDAPDLFLEFIGMMSLEEWGQRFLGVSITPKC